MCFTNYSTIQIQLQIRLWTWIHIIIKQWDRIRHIAKNVFVKTREIKSERLFTLESNFFNCSSYEIVVLDQIIILLESSVWNISAIKVQNQSILTLFSTRTVVTEHGAQCSAESAVVNRMGSTMRATVLASVGLFMASPLVTGQRNGTNRYTRVHLSEHLSLDNGLTFFLD